MLTDLISPARIFEPKTASPAAFASVRRLFEAFALNGIRYCHWKSNLRLERGMLGQTDMDLLFDPSQADLLRRVLAEQDIKRVLAPPGKRYPGIEDYLGFDFETGALFHLHVHFQLVLGEQFVKNYHLPLEEQFLNSTVSVGGWVNIPTPELELSILCLRALLKYRDRDALKDILSIRSSGLPAHILDELGWLSRQTNMDDMARVLSELAGTLPAETILEFLETISSHPRDGWRLLRLRGQVRQALNRYQRQNRVTAIARYARELWRRQVLPRFRPARGMTLPEGGLTISLVGVDGSGKTTLTARLQKWLGWRMDVHSHYLGSKKPSRLSSALYLAFRMARRSGHELGQRFGQGNWLARGLDALKNSLLAAHYLSIGRDRRRRYAAAVQQAQGGSIALFDRFPYEAPLDGPLIDPASGRLAAFLSRREQAMYRQFRRADLIVLLKVTPEISHQRKPDHALETLRRKDEALAKLEAELRADASANWTTQNADLPLEEVLLQLKRKLWAAL